MPRDSTKVTMSPSRLDHPHHLPVSMKFKVTSTWNVLWKLQGFWAHERFPFHRPKIWTNRLFQGNLRIFEFRGRRVFGHAMAEKIECQVPLTQIAWYVRILWLELWFSNLPKCRCRTMPPYDGLVRPWPTMRSSREIPISKMQMLVILSITTDVK